MNRKPIIFQVVIILLLSGCVSTQVGSNIDAGSIGVDFAFQKENMCFGPSPQITLTHLPSETKGLKVSLRDLDHPGPIMAGAT